MFKNTFGFTGYISGGGGGTVLSVTATSPLFSSGGANPNLTIQQANAIQDGYLSSADWNLFNSKIDGSGIANQVAYFTAASTVGGSTGFVFDPININLGLGTSLPTHALTIYRNSNIQLTTYNQNGGVNLTANTNIFQHEIQGFRNGGVGNQTIARIEAIYIGDGITRRGQYKIGTAEDGGFGNHQLNLFSIANIKYSVIGGGGAGVVNPATPANFATPYSPVASLIFAPSFTALASIAFFTNAGLAHSIISTNDRWVIGGTTDAGFKVDIVGTERVQGRLTVNQDTTVTPMTAAVIQSGTTNASLVIAPNGNGALIANIPDNGVTGGNARGNIAVDLQMSRGSANQVASGAASTICGGEQNRASNIYAVIAGGQSNTASGVYSSVLAGISNTASASYSSVGGGQSNSASGQHSVVAGGNSNSASGFYSFVGGGTSNTASAFGANISCGVGNIASGIISGILCGESNSASGRASWSAGERNTASVDYGIAIGYFSRAYLYGQLSKGSGSFTATIGVGDAQTSSVTARRSVTGIIAPSSLDLTLDGGTPAAGNRLILGLPSGATNARLWAATIQIVAIVTTVGAGTVLLNDSFVGNYECGIKRVGSSAALVGSVSPTSELSDANMTSNVVTITADNTNFALNIAYTPPTGAAADTVIRVVATVYLTEVGR